MEAIRGFASSFIALCFLSSCSGCGGEKIQSQKCRSVVNASSMVILAVGQSNAANEGEVQYTSKQPVYMYHDKRCEPANDPLIGATGNRGSVWSRLGDKVIENGLAKSVLISSVAVNASKVRDWIRGGKYHHKLKDAIAGLKELGIEITHILWHQGESDKELSEEEYKSKLSEVISSTRSYGVDAPFFVSIASVCKGPPHIEVQKAQRSIVSPENNIFSGPNTDQLDDSFRYDRCHFNESGLQRHADLWITAIQNVQSEFVRNIFKNSD